MSFSFSIGWWWVAYYYAIGVGTWLPLNYVAWKTTRGQKRPFWSTMGRWFRSNGFWGSLWKATVQVIFWPIAAFEAFPL